jgi:hypothetical protein
MLKKAQNITSFVELGLGKGIETVVPFMKEY